LAGFKAELLDEFEKYRWMRFAISEFSRNEDDAEKGSDPQIIQDISCRRTVGEISQQSKAILLLQRGEHRLCARDQMAVFKKGGKITVNCGGDSPIFGLNPPSIRLLKSLPWAT
jgi:hypothetical protein